MFRQKERRVQAMKEGVLHTKNREASGRRAVGSAARGMLGQTMRPAFLSSPRLASPLTPLLPVHTASLPRVSDTCEIGQDPHSALQEAALYPGLGAQGWEVTLASAWTSTLS